MTIRQVQGYVALFRKEDREQELAQTVSRRLAAGANSAQWKKYIAELESEDGNDD